MKQQLKMGFLGAWVSTVLFASPHPLEVDGFIVASPRLSGGLATRALEAGREALFQDCEQLEAELAKLFAPATLAGFRCGRMDYYSAQAGANSSAGAFYAFPHVALKIPSHWNRQSIQEVSGNLPEIHAPFAGESDLSAARAFQKKCLNQMYQVKSLHRERFAAASCGTPRFVKDSDGTQALHSQMRVWLREIP